MVDNWHSQVIQILSFSKGQQLSSYSAAFYLISQDVNFAKFLLKQNTHIHTYPHMYVNIQTHIQIYLEGTSGNHLRYSF